MLLHSGCRNPRSAADGSVGRIGAHVAVRGSASTHTGRDGGLRRRLDSPDTARRATVVVTAIVTVVCACMDGPAGGGGSGDAAAAAAPAAAPVHPFGCKHYVRRCRIIAPCCCEVFPCRQWCVRRSASSKSLRRRLARIALCRRDNFTSFVVVCGTRVCPLFHGLSWTSHDATKDEGEPDFLKRHKINRFAVEECLCCACGTRQRVSNKCEACGEGRLAVPTSALTASLADATSRCSLQAASLETTTAA